MAVFYFAAINFAFFGHHLFMRKDVDVIAKMKKIGRIEPLEIIWEDGRNYQIDKILDARPMASTKGGGAGLRYKVRLGQNIRYLFLDGFIWFVETEN